MPARQAAKHDPFSHDAAFAAAAAAVSSGSSNSPLDQRQDAPTAPAHPRPCPDMHGGLSRPWRAMTLTMLLASNHGPLAIERDFHRRREGLGQLGELHRRARMQADRVCEHASRSRSDAAFGPPDSAFGSRSGLIPATTLLPFASPSASEAPPEASVAAITAPSTIGALQTTTWPARRRRASRSPSRCWSRRRRDRRVWRRPPPTRPCRWRSMIALDIGAEPAIRRCRRTHASGTSSPTIWRTMSAVPSATIGECDTMTMPTLLMLTAPDFAPRPHQIARSRRAPGSMWPIERSPRNEARPRNAFIGTVASAARRRYRRFPAPSLPRASAVMHRLQHVEHRLLPTCDLPRAPPPRSPCRKPPSASARSGSAGNLLAERHEQGAEQRAGRAADRHHQLGADRLQRLRQRLCRERISAPPAPLRSRASC